MNDKSRCNLASVRNLFNIVKAFGAQVCFVLLMILVVRADMWTDPNTGLSWYFEVCDGEACISCDPDFNPSVVPPPEGDLVIPGEIDSVPVTGIGGFSFMNYGAITSVTIPAGVRSIGQFAFGGCQELRDVKLPDSVMCIEEGAFLGCCNITNVTIPQYVLDQGLTNVFPGAHATLESVTVLGGATDIPQGAFAGCTALRHVTVPPSVAQVDASVFADSPNIETDLVIADGVTKIAAGEFAGRSWILNVSIPASVTTIAANAFVGCTGIRNVTVPQSVLKRRLKNVFPDAYKSIRSVTILDGTTSISSYALSDCGRLEEVVIPSSVRNIATYAFKNCASLTSLDIPVGVTDIGNYAFHSCSSLAQISIPSGVTSLGVGAFFGCNGLERVEIPQGVTSIGSMSFSSCSKIRDVMVPQLVLNKRLRNVFPSAYKAIESVAILDGARLISNFAFDKCWSLKYVSIPDSVTNIGDSAFRDCKSLSGISIPSCVTSIGKNAFSGCAGLTSMTIPESVDSIGSGAFSGCTGLMSFAVSEGNQHYVVHSGLLLDSEMKRLVAVPGGLEVVTIPNGVTSIEPRAFQGSSALSSVTIPESVTSFGVDAFANCSSLESITIPVGVTSIEEGVFNGCPRLECVTIPQLALDMGLQTVFPDSYQAIEEVTILDGVTNIPANAFSGCVGLKRVEIPSSVASIEPGAFTDCNGIGSVVVPQLVLDMGMRNVFPRAWDIADVTILDDATSISSAAFSCCTGIRSLNIGAGVTNVDEVALSSCWDITNVVVPQCVLDIGLRNVFDDDGCNSIKHVTILDGVASIPDYAFADVFESLEGVTLPDSVTNIGMQAFSHCERLSDMKIPSGVVYIGVSAFSHCESLSEVVIPEGMVSIEGAAFSGCKGLRNVVIPDGVAIIKVEAFARCSSLESVSIGSGLRAISEYAFGEGCSSLQSFEVSPDNERFYSASGLLVEKGTDRLVAVPNGLAAVVVPDGVRGIMYTSFQGCHAETISIPVSVESIASRAFNRCPDLLSFTVAPDAAYYSSGSGLLLSKSGSAIISVPMAVSGVVIPAGVTSIGDYAFSGCSNLVEADLPEGLMSIGQYAFENCTSLTAITIPASVTSIGRNAFTGCTGIKSITISQNVLDLGVAQVFSAIRAKIENVTIASGATSIPRQAFNGFSNLKKVTILGGLKTIGAQAFYGCSKLEEVDIPGSVESIGSKAFYNCSALKCVNLPSGCQIASDAFQSRNNGDWDGDGLSDTEERARGTNPYNQDTDGDGLKDGLEARTNGLDPLQPDSDGDGMNDGWEYQHRDAGFNPAVNNANDGNPDNDADADPDGDGLTNKEECEWGTNPDGRDRNGDGKPDGWDSDGDGVSDGAEVKQNSDPSDASDGGRPNSRIPVSFCFGDPSGSHSEKYRLKVAPVVGHGERPAAFEWLNENYGECETKKSMLKPGWKYEVRLFHAGTNPSYNGTPRPDYDYELICNSGPHSGRVIVVDENGLFDGCDNGEKFTASGKVAYIYVLGDPVLVFDYDRDGKITDEEADIAREGKTTFRFWINDDKDSGDVNDSDNDIPGNKKPNYADDHVNGRGDLLDFTPVWIDTRYVFPEGARVFVPSFRWKVKSPCVNVVWTYLKRGKAGAFGNTNLDYFGNAISDIAESADVVKICESKPVAPILEGAMMRDADRGVFLIEGSAAGTDLVVEGWSGEGESAKKIVEGKANIRISGVEKMYRYADLRPVIKGKETTVTGKPENEWDAMKCDRDVFFTHGFRVSAADAHAWGSEVYKRLWQSGSNARFVMFTWAGDYGWPDSALYFPQNVYQALRTGGALKALVESVQPDSSKRILMTQSLGNMVACEALRQGLQVEKYFMFDAAVATECFDGTLQSEGQRVRQRYVPAEWHDYDNGSWAANWYRPFTSAPNDARGSMGWVNRYSVSLNNATEVYNYYSTGDDVFWENSTVPSVTEDMIDVSSSVYAWQKQETHKGMRTIAGTWDGGWGFHTWRMAGFDYRYTSADAARMVADGSVTNNPVFNRGYAPMFNSNATQDEIMYALAKCVPAISSPVGGTSVYCDMVDENHNMNQDHYRSGVGSPANPWKHSDMKDVAYFYVNPLYKELVTKGGLK